MIGLRFCLAANGEDFLVHLRDPYHSQTLCGLKATSPLPQNRRKVTCKECLARVHTKATAVA